MTNELLSLLSFSLSIAAYTVKELQMHGKLRWMQHGNYVRSFWDEDSYLRKYKLTDRSTVIVAPKTWYYRFFKIKYKERFPCSATFLVFLTDGMHLMQFLFFLFISLSVVPILGWTYGIAFWILAHVIHFVLYRTLQR